MLTAKANKILVEEIFPLVTSAFSSITSELMQKPCCHEDDGELIKREYEKEAKKFASLFKNYVDTTAELQYEILTTKEFSDNR